MPSILDHAFAFDTETYLIAPGRLIPYFVCMTWTTDGKRVDLHTRVEGVGPFEQALAERRWLIAHNAPFDLAVMAENFPKLQKGIWDAFTEGRVFDTQVAQELLDIASGRNDEGGKVFVDRGNGRNAYSYDLAGLVMHYLGKDRSKEKSDPDAWRLRYLELDGVALKDWPAAAVSYAKEDAEDAWHVARNQLAVCRTHYPTVEGFVEEVVRQTRAKWALFLEAAWGIRTDREFVLPLEEKLTKARNKNRKRLIQTQFLKPKRMTPKEVAELDGAEPDFQETKATKKGLETIYYRYSKDTHRIQEHLIRALRRKGKEPAATATGRIKMDREALNDSGAPLLKLLADSSGVDKILDTYLPVLKSGMDIPINAGFSVLKNTGRTSMFKPNLQNLPTGRVVGGVRECFIPRPGFYFVSVDYSTLELRALAQCTYELFGHSRMMDVINEGKDLHHQMAAEILGVSYDQIAKNCKVKGSPEKFARDCAKVANFGYPGGLGAASLVDYARNGYGIHITEQQARKLKSDWLSAWPEMRSFFDYVNNLVGRAGAGRITQPWSGRVRGDVGYCDGCNTFFQGRAADGAKVALFNISRAMYSEPESPLYGSRLVAFIHDEFLAEVPVAKAHEASYELARVACESMAEVIPDVEIKAEPALMKRWWKEADTVLDSNGRLIPWEPAPKTK